MGPKSRHDEYLAAVPLFRACSGKQLTRVAQLAEELDIPAGDVLANEGRIENELYVIVEGDAEVTRSGRRVTALGQGDYFGELALLDRSPRNATVTATTPMRVLSISAREFYTMLGEFPTVTGALLRGMARRLNDADGRPAGAAKRLTALRTG
jgi:CRP/FNR family cyclic AMP-dependent transcriptional regulator